MLGASLLTAGAITSPQLDAALERQRMTGARLGESLLSLAFISEGALSRALADQARVPFVGMSDVRPDRAAAALVPEAFARKHLLAPVNLDGSALVVVQANPLDVLPLDDLRQFTSRPVSAICAQPEDVRTLLDWCYTNAPDEPREEAPPSPEPVETVETPRDDVALTLPVDVDAHRVRPLSELGFNRRDLGLVTELLSAPQGVVIVTDPDGAGKTTIYSMLAALVGPSKNILTIEDLVETPLPGTRQTQANPSTGLTYAAAVRSMLRQYPDAIMIADIREPDAAEMALRAAQSGVLVLTTLTEEDAASAVARLVDMRIEPYLIASYLTGIIAQRLVRLICADCREPVTYPAEMLEKVGLAPEPGVLFVRGRGCEHCDGSGYRGYTGTYEILAIDSALQALIRERADVRAIARGTADTRMRPLFDDALAKAILQQITLEEVIRVTRARRG